MDPVDILLRVAAATAIGTLVGVEREARGQLAGMRTNALVAVGACLFTLGGAYGFPELLRDSVIDPMRVAAQIVSGIGFIGAGAILRDRGGIRGVTTAAALWVSASLGLAAGAGLFVAAGIGLAATLVTLVGLRLVRDHLLSRILYRQQTISVTYRRGQGTLAPIITIIEDAAGRLSRLSIDDENDRRHVLLEVRVRDVNRLRHRLATLANRPEVDEISYG